jgi:hypothetical protein
MEWSTLYSYLGRQLIGSWSGNLTYPQRHDRIALLSDVTSSECFGPGHNDHAPNGDQVWLRYCAIGEGPSVDVDAMAHYRLGGDATTTMQMIVEIASELMFAIVGKSFHLIPAVSGGNRGQPQPSSILGSV